MEITIIGNGAWGSAIASLFEENKTSYRFWQEGKKIPDSSIVVLAIPTQAFRTVLSTIGEVQGLTVINGAKGIEKETHLLPYQIVNEMLPSVQYLTLMGPSFAEEVVSKMQQYCLTINRIGAL